MGFLKSAAYVAALACVPFVVELATRKRFPVPQPGGGVVVTGASTGIGRHAAETLAQDGFLVFAGVRKEADGEALQAAHPERIVPVILDVTKQEQVDAALATVRGELAGRGNLPLVGLVNNAGVAGASQPVEFLNFDDLHRTYDVNVLGVLRVTKAFLPMLRASQGRVINISSVAGLISAPLMAMYSSTKWALEAVSDSLRGELDTHGVSVSVVEPAYVKSEIFGKAAAGRKDGEEGLALYGHLVPNPVLQERRISKASEPTVTSDAILHALTAEYPKTRYIVANVGGVPATVLAWLNYLLNDRINDRLTLLAIRGE